MSARKRSTIRWRRIAATAARRPVVVSSTPLYGRWSSRPRSASRFTIAVTVPGDTPSRSASAPVWAASSEVLSRYTDFNSSRSDFVRVLSMVLAARELRFCATKTSSGRRPYERVVGVQDGEPAAMVADHPLGHHAGAGPYA